MLTIRQVHRIINAVRVDRIAVYFWTVYSLGLRLDEARHLQVGDVDAERGWVHVHRGKGAKDRYVPLPTSTLGWLRRHWLTHRHPRLLFPAEGRDHKQSSISKAPIETSTIQSAMKKVVSDSRIVACDENSVTYRYRPTGAKTDRVRKVDGHEFVRGFVQHTLPDRFQKIRHYGWMSSNSRINLEEVKWLVWVCLGWTYWLVSGHVSQDPPPSRAVVHCAACGQSMRVVGVTNSSEVLSNHALAYLDSG